MSNLKPTKRLVGKKNRGSSKEHEDGVYLLLFMFCVLQDTIAEEGDGESVAELTERVASLRDS